MCISTFKGIIFDARHYCGDIILISCSALGNHDIIQIILIAV